MRIVRAGTASAIQDEATGTIVISYPPRFWFFSSNSLCNCNLFSFLPCLTHFPLNRDTYSVAFQPGHYILPRLLSFRFDDPMNDTDAGFRFRDAAFHLFRCLYS